MRQPLSWRDPARLVRALAEERGLEGLVWLDGDGTPLGRRGLLAAGPREQVVCRGLPGEPGATDPFAVLAALTEAGGTWLGWIGYEAGAWVEPGSHWRPPAMALLWAARYDELLHIEPARRSLRLEGSDPNRLAALATRLEALPAGEEREGGEPPDPGGARVVPLEGWHWHTPPAVYATQVARIREWIAAGDLFQANLTACCEQALATPPDPLALYLRLRRACPAPFAALAIAGGAAAGEAVLSASPERFLHLDPSGRVETRPIKGTRPRHTDPTLDADAAADLVSSPKDRAENVMIVDLLRNDLGRVCRSGSIQVPQIVGLESYTHVHHLTSVVRGELAAGCGLADLLRACWPGGSITGAPKVRACRRLAELEPVPRGPYCGSLFHLAADGGFDSSILIRSVMVKGRCLRVHAGGGIVADSDPAAEAEEMGWKLGPLLEALA